MKNVSKNSKLQRLQTQTIDKLGKLFADTESLKNHLLINYVINHRRGTHQSDIILALIAYLTSNAETIKRMEEAGLYIDYYTSNGEVLTIFCGIKGLGIITQIDAYQDVDGTLSADWRVCHSKGNYGKRYASGGNWITVGQSPNSTILANPPAILTDTLKTVALSLIAGNPTALRTYRDTCTNTHIACLLPPAGSDTDGNSAD